MIREIIARGMTEFPKAKTEPYKQHPFAAWLRETVPNELAARFAPAGELTVAASAGKGNWVTGPWIALFDPIVTLTAQEGHYVVYLFSSDAKRVYLSLNQGVTSLKAELKTKVARSTLSTRASVLAARVREEYGERFIDDPIDLRATKSGGLLDLYEHGHAFGRAYQQPLPDENELNADLAEMLRLYRLVTARGGTSDLGMSDDDAEGASLVERRRVFMHKRVERNATLAREAKRVHGYTCQVCGFNFTARYDLLGEGYIEAHHKVPLSEMDEGSSGRLSPRDDFAVVCANCHRMLHRKDAPKSFEGFLAAFRSHSGPA